MSISLLPKNIKMLIFNYLNYAELLNVELVCKNFKQIADSYYGWKCRHEFGLTEGGIGKKEYENCSGISLLKRVRSRPSKYQELTKAHHQYVRIALIGHRLCYEIREDQRDAVWFPNPPSLSRWIKFYDLQEKKSEKRIQGSLFENVYCGAQHKKFYSFDKSLLVDLKIDFNYKLSFFDDPHTKNKYLYILDYKLDEEERDICYKVDVVNSATVDQQYLNEKAKKIQGFDDISKFTCLMNYNKIASIKENILSVFDFNSEKKHAVFVPFKAEIYARFSDENTLVCISLDHTWVAKIDLVNFKVHVWNIAFLREGEKICACTAFNEIIVIGTSTGRVFLYHTSFQNPRICLELNKFERLFYGKGHCAVRGIQMTKDYLAIAWPEKIKIWKCIDDN